MSFASRPTDELIRIAASGGGFRLDAGPRPTADLIRIAAAGSGSGARLIFAGMESRPTDELIRIAAAGNGAVQFIGIEK